MPRFVNSEHPPTDRIPMVVGDKYRITYPDGPTGRQPIVLTYQGPLSFGHLYFIDDKGHKVDVEPGARMQKIKGGRRSRRSRRSRSRKH